MTWPRRHHSRHHISELDTFRFSTDLEAEDSAEPFLSLSDVEIIDHESLARSLVGLSRTAVQPATHRDRHLSAVPRAQMATVARASLPWGLGTDGWPRRLSRHVRLFFGDHHRVAAIAAGRTWDRLVLADEIEQRDDGQTLVIAGRLQMPYPSRPLEVEVRLQPFEARFVRVDLVLTSRHRYPRRYFDVASLALSAMQEIEAAPMPRTRFTSRKDPRPAGTLER